MVNETETSASNFIHSVAYILKLCLDLKTTTLVILSFMMTVETSIRKTEVSLLFTDFSTTVQLDLPQS